jgi:hypothetical protein
MYKFKDGLAHSFRLRHLGLHLEKMTEKTMAGVLQVIQRLENLECLYVDVKHIVDAPPEWLDTITILEKLTSIYIWNVAFSEQGYKTLTDMLLKKPSTTYFDIFSEKETKNDVFNIYEKMFTRHYMFEYQDSWFDSHFFTCSYFLKLLIFICGSAEKNPNSPLHGLKLEFVIKVAKRHFNIFKGIRFRQT